MSNQRDELTDREAIKCAKILMERFNIRDTTYNRAYFVAAFTDFLLLIEMIPPPRDRSER